MLSHTASRATSCGLWRLHHDPDPQFGILAEAVNPPSATPRLPRHTRVLMAFFGSIGRLALRLGYKPFTERCSWCRRDLPVGQAFYIGGRRGCSACAERGRRRLLPAAWAFVAPTGGMGVMASARAIQTVRPHDPHVWPVGSLPIVIALF